MPTFNQLVKQGRKQATYKSNSPAMQKGLNTLKKLDEENVEKRVAFEVSVSKLELVEEARESIV